MKKLLPTVDDIIKTLNHRDESTVGANQIKLHKDYGLESLVDLYVAAFPSIRYWIGRKYILSYLTRFVREKPNVLKLAKYALNDKSWLVRHDACGALAYALDDSAIPALKKLLNSTCDRTKENAVAAIDAISNKNHHYFVDREHTGRSFWYPDGDMSDQPNIHTSEIPTIES